MTTTLRTSHLVAGHRAISMQAADVAELHGRIANVLNVGDGPSVPEGASIPRPADVLVVVDAEPQGASTDSSPSLAPEGWLVLWGDDRSRRRTSSVSDASVGIAQRHVGPVLRFGRSADGDVVATDVTFAEGRLHFRVGQQWFHVPAWARSSLKEVLAAVAVARIFAVPLAQAAERLADSPPIGSPRQVVEAGDVTIIHDKTATTADVARATLDLLREYPAIGRRIVCCGDLLDRTGSDAGRALGEELVTRCGADELIACGEGGQVVGQAARAAGLSADCVKVCGDVGEVVRRLVETLTDGDVLLVVGGPAEVMSQLVQCIRDTWCADLAPQAVVVVGDWMTATSSPTFTS